MSREEFFKMAEVTACLSTVGMKPTEKEKKLKMLKERVCDTEHRTEIILRQETRTGQCYECTQTVGMAYI